MKSILDSMTDDPAVRQNVAERLAQTRPPRTWLGQMDICEIPSYLKSLAVVARAISGIAIYDDDKINRSNAVFVVELVQNDWEEARRELGIDGS